MSTATKTGGKKSRKVKSQEMPDSDQYLGQCWTHQQPLKYHVKPMLSHVSDCGATILSVLPAGYPARKESQTLKFGLMPCVICIWW